METSGPEPNLDKIVSEPADEGRESLADEQGFLTRQKAKSASFRAVVAHDEHVETLKSERDRLREQLDDSIKRIEFLSPRVAELEQAAKNAKSNGIQSTLSGVIGTALVAIAPLADGVYQATMASFGSASVIWAAVLFLRTNKSGWPDQNP